jgi:hypothetical protein
MNNNLKTFPRAENPDSNPWLIWKKKFDAELREMYYHDDFSAHVLIQHILKETGEEI